MTHRKVETSPTNLAGNWWCRGVQLQVLLGHAAEGVQGLLPGTAQGAVHGYNVDFTSVCGHRGRTALPRGIVQSSSSLVRKAREAYIGVKGAK